MNTKLSLSYKKQLVTVLLASSVDAIAAGNQPINLDIPSQPLTTTLEQLSKSSNTPLIYADNAVKGAMAAELKGTFTVQQALSSVLAKSDLNYQQNKDGSISIQKAASKKPSNNDNATFELGHVVVNDSDKSGKLSSRDIATSVDIMYADKIADQNVLNAYDLFHRMPGVQITQFGQGITTGKLSFRGFNGEGRVNAVKLLIDGIPSNTNDGNMPFIDALFPLDIESIEVVKGTNDPRYGLHNIAGNANITTTSGGNYAKGRVSYGSFNTHDVQSGFGYEKGGLSQNYAISYRASDGYRDHSQSDKNSFSGKWAFTPDNQKYKAGLNVRWSEADAQEPGYLTYQQQLASTTQSMPHNATDGGKRQVGQISSFFDINLSNTLLWSTKAYSNTYKEQRFVRFDACCAQVERERDETQYGAITTLTYHPTISWLNDFTLETGFDFQHQDNQYQQYRTDNTIRRPAITSANIRNEESWNFLNYGGYIQAVIKPTKWLKITPGYRADQIEGDNLINLRPGSVGSYPMNDYGVISQPKVGAVITPIDGYSVYGNWGRSFQVGLGSSTFKKNAFTANMAPSLNDGWEVGVKLKPVAWAEGRIAYWRQVASNEMSRNLASSDSTYLGSTNREGVDVEVKVNPTDSIGVWTAYSLQEAKIKSAGNYVANSYEYKVGNWIVNTPDYLFSAGVDYQITRALKSSLWTSGQGNFFVDQANAVGKFGEYSLLNLDLGYQVNKQVDVQFQAKNLANTQRDYLWYDETYGPGLRQPLFSPADGIAFYGAVNVKYDF